MSSRPSDVILFDLDDTIVDYESSAEPAWKAVCEEAARRVSALDSAQLLATIAEVRRWYWSDADRHRQGRANLHAASEWIVAEALRRRGHDLPTLAGWISSRYRDLRRDSLTLIAGAIETLHQLREHDVRLGLVTNGTSFDQREKIDRFGLAAYFDHVFVEGELGYGKPDERVYRRALEMFGVPAADTWFVGDNLEWDVAAPQRLGLYTVWVDAKGAGLPAGAAVPNRVVRSIAELL